MSSLFILIYLLLSHESYIPPTSWNWKDDRCFPVTVSPCPLQLSFCLSLFLCFFLFLFLSCFGSSEWCLIFWHFMTQQVLICLRFHCCVFVFMSELLYSAFFFLKSNCLFAYCHWTQLWFQTMLRVKSHEVKKSLKNVCVCILLSGLFVIIIWI